MVLFKPEMGLLRPGMGPFRHEMGPFEPRMGPFRLYMGPLGLTKVFFTLIFFLIQALLGKNSGTNSPSFLFWVRVLQGPWELSPANENPVTASASKTFLLMIRLNLAECVKK